MNVEEQVEKFDIREFKRKEYIGDAVLSLIIRELMYEPSPNKERRAANLNLCANMCSNSHLSRVAEALEMVPVEPSWNGKRMANLVEVKICEVYEQDGLEAARRWVIEHLVSMYDMGWLS